MRTLHYHIYCIEEDGMIPALSVTRDRLAIINGYDIISAYPETNTLLLPGTAAKHPTGRWCLQSNLDTWAPLKGITHYIIFEEVPALSLTIPTKSKWAAWLDKVADTVRGWFE